jgi:hypothetical protein
MMVQALGRGKGKDATACKEASCASRTRQSQGQLNGGRGLEWGEPKHRQDDAGNLRREVCGWKALYQSGLDQIHNQHQLSLGY